MLKKINGTLVWYASVCDRETWLMFNNFLPEEDNDNLTIGRTIDKQSYKRMKKGLEIEGSKLDIVDDSNGITKVIEVKKSSKYLEAYENQLIYYLSIMRNQGIECVGELRIPTEKKVIPVKLTDETSIRLDRIKDKLEEIENRENPPSPVWKGFCKQCGYERFCWS